MREWQSLMNSHRHSRWISFDSVEELFSDGHVQEGAHAHHGGHVETAAVAEEGERDAGDGHEADGDGDVHEDVEREYGDDAGRQKRAGHVWTVSGK